MNVKHNIKPKTRTVIISMAVAALLLIAGVAGFIFTNHKLNQKEYKKQLAIGDKYLADADYEAAIIAYQAAIKADPEAVKTYETLANVYLTLKDYGKAKYILRKGISRTESARLDDLLWHIQSGEYEKERAKIDAEDLEVVSKDVALNTGTLQVIVDYTYENYTKKCKEVKVKAVSKERIEAEYEEFDAVFIYENTDDIQTVNVKKGRPYNDQKPTTVIFHNLNGIFQNFQGAVDFQRLQSLFQNQAVCRFDEDLKSYVVEADYKGMHIVLESDEHGNIISQNAVNYLNPPAGTGKEGMPYSVSGKVIDATTGEGVSAEMLMHFNGNGREADDITVVSDEKGNYDTELEAGAYLVEISADGYITESFSLQVEDSAAQTGVDFTISPELSSQEVRIVLEWGERPMDLDSYLQCSDLETVYFGNKELKKGNETIAALDLDDRNGYGPETTTIYNLKHEYSFCVEDFGGEDIIGDSQATVKVYLPGKAPVTYHVPEESGNHWCVFKLQNGELEECNKIIDFSEDGGQVSEDMM